MPNPNIVGIGNSQVPTNAMLGDLAYQDSIGEHSIPEIKGRINETAIYQGLFVYDTRKDSDGGAWRKRTQHTSWYNEVPSMDRGTRKEFPAVAIIVAETSGDDTVTIYDGDDPNCAMWMVFRAGGTNGQRMIGRTSEYTTCVKALNGMLYVGRRTFGLHVIDFITDKGHFKEHGYDTPYALPVGSHRNGGNRWVYSGGGGVHQLSNDEVYSLDAKVMPNTPFNPDRGIPDPTLVIATDTHIEAHLGMYNKLLVSSSQGSYNPEAIIFTENGGLVVHNDSHAQNNNGIVFARDYHHIHLLAWSTYVNWESVYYRSNYAGLGKVTILQHSVTDAFHRLAAMRGHDFAVGTSEALNLIHPEPIFNSSTVNQDLVAYIRHTYNTGWMPRDTMVNNLNSTEVGINTSGANIFSNGTFDSNITGWQNWDTNRGSVTHNSGRMRFNNSGTGDVYAYGVFDHTLPPGTTFTVSGNYYSISGGNATMVQIYPYNDDLGSFPDSGGLGTYAGTDGTRASSYSFSGGADGTFHITTTVDSPGGATGVLLGVDPNGTGPIFELDNLTCTYTQGRLTDRTKPYGDDFVTFGSVTKTPVADGAELMAFGNFTSSNYIRCGTNPNLEMGSGDFYYIFWVNPGSSSSGKVVLSHWSYNVDSSVAGRVGLYFNSGNIRLDLGDDGTTSGQYQAITGTNGIQDSNGWHMVCGIRRGHTAELWVDGKLDASQELGSNADGTYSNKKRIIEIGHSNGMGSPDDGIKVTLVRIGKTRAPTKEQLEKMYKDELQLFGKNAKCTLFGSAAAITGLAFDDSTNVLHAGTSVGRSDFRGLVRINNTETPVTTAISASNGLIIEQ